MILTYFVVWIHSQNGKFSYGYASSPGKRSSMEDFYETRIDGVDGEVVGLFGVFDGIFI
jgi:protein phosphatase 1L